MDDIIYNSLVQYFNTLKFTGYINNNDVSKLLFMIMIEEFINNDFKGIISQDDYSKIDTAIYKLLGTSCLLPYPKYCIDNKMNRLHLGDISELAHIVLNNRKEVQHQNEIIKEHGDEIIDFENKVSEKYKQFTDNVDDKFNEFTTNVDDKLVKTNSKIDTINKKKIVTVNVEK